METTNPVKDSLDKVVEIEGLNKLMDGDLELRDV